MSPLLEIESVSMEFRARKGLFTSVPVRALDNVSLHLNKGETVAIVGESGSGKTTLGRVCLRLLTPTGGAARFDGEDIGKAGSQNTRTFYHRVQGIFQDPFSSLDPNMTVGQIVEEPLIIHKEGNSAERKRAVHQALEEVRLLPTEDFVNRFPHRLSGGQRQRVAIARALVLQPELVIADEPVSMVDASNRAEILYLLRGLQERHGTAFLYITHDIATAYHFSQRIAVMYLGRIVETGPTHEVVNNPLHPYTQALLKAVPEPDPANRFRRRATAKGEPPSPAAPPPGCHFHPRCPQAFDRCQIQSPPLLEVLPSHDAACHLWPVADPNAVVLEAPPTP